MRKRTEICTIVILLTTVLHQGIVYIYFFPLRYTHTHMCGCACVCVYILVEKNDYLKTRFESSRIL